MNFFSFNFSLREYFFCTSPSPRPHKFSNGPSLSNDDDDGGENFAKKMNLRLFKLYRVYLDPLNMSNVGDFSWS